MSEQGLANLTWRVTVLCTSEESFYAGEGGDTRRNGERVRLAEIPVPKPELGGIFPSADLDLGERMARGRDLAKAVEGVTRENYGKAMPRFIRGLLELGEEQLKDEVRRMMDEFRAGLPDFDTSFAARLASKFALVCAGGRLAARFGVAPFDEERCERACARLFQTSLKAMSPKVRMTAERFAKALNRALLDPARLPEVEEGQCLPSDVLEPLGVVRTVGGDRAVLIRQVDLRRVADAPIDMAMIDELDRRGVLIVGGDGKRTVQAVVAGWPTKGRLRYYAFKVARIERLANGRPTTA